MPHRRLIKKLQAYGFGGKLANWIESFLVGRTQVVSVRGTVSTYADVVSGVPQGSVLGPTAFHPLPEIVNSNVQMFVDDTKTFTTVELQEDSCKIQNDIDALLEWSQKWLLRFNAGKCKTLGSNNPKCLYKMGDVELNAIEQEKDSESIFVMIVAVYQVCSESHEQSPGLQTNI